MPHKKNHNQWFIIILLLIGSVLLFRGGPDYYSSRSLKYFWDMGHILYFALLTVLLCQWSLISRMSLIWQWCTILAIAFLIGVFIELMQYGTTRTPDTGDILRDLTGSLLALVFGPLGSKLQSTTRQLSLRLFVMLLTLVQLWPLTKSLIDEAIARHQFPLISGFETPFEIDRWEGGHRLSVVSITPVPEGKVMKLSLTTDKYSGATLKYFDGNWASARTLQISLYNPDTNPLQITCRIHDLQHAESNQAYEDRFNRSYTLMPAWNHIVIDLNEVEESPAGRNMDMSHIRELGLFVVSLPTSRTLYLDEVRLTY
jgi:VanZ family protein